MRLLWVRSDFRTGGSFGYSVHGTRLRHAVEALGVEVTTDPEDTYDVAIHVSFPADIRLVDGVRNVVFSQVELSDVKSPQWWRDHISKATLVCTSSTHGAKVISKYVSPDRVEVVPLGVDTDVFRYHERKAPGPGEKYRILWVDNVAAPEKSFATLVLTLPQWEASGTMPDIELYVKDSGIEGGVRQVHPGSNGRVTVDRRLLSAAEMAELYRSAHIFLKCSAGEGWGMSLTEAMATGLPSIWAHYSAMVDYASESTGFPITFGSGLVLAPFQAEPGEIRVNSVDPSKIACYGAMMDAGALIGRLEEIIADYPAALDRGKRASERMSAFTWEASARKFIAACERVLDLPIIPAEPTEANGAAGRFIEQPRGGNHD